MMKIGKCEMNREEKCLLENTDYAKWQQSRFDNMSFDESQEAVVAYAQENLFINKV